MLLLQGSCKYLSRSCKIMHFFFGFFKRILQDHGLKCFLCKILPSNVSLVRNFFGKHLLARCFKEYINWKDSCKDCIFLNQGREKTKKKEMIPREKEIVIISHTNINRRRREVGSVKKKEETKRSRKNPQRLRNRFQTSVPVCTRLQVGQTQSMIIF